VFPQLAGLAGKPRDAYHGWNSKPVISLKRLPQLDSKMQSQGSDNEGEEGQD
jgi:hypothetical protein